MLSNEDNFCEKSKYDLSYQMMENAYGRSYSIKFVIKFNLLGAVHCDSGMI